MTQPNGLITLTSDFGTRDGYVGAVKGVICHLLPQARVVDITHEIPPQNLMEALLLLEVVYPWFPEGTVHWVVVDPGVGTDRRALAVAARGQYFVGPDNGVLSGALRDPDARVHAITAEEYMLPAHSDTFHGRDIFAPAAAHLAGGVAIERLGPAVGGARVLELPRPQLVQGRLEGEVLRVDRFGNVISNVPRALLGQLGPGPYRVSAREVDFGRLHRRYQDVPAGEPLALIGGDGRVEIAVNEGNAAQRYKLVPGDRMVVEGDGASPVGGA